MEKSSTAPQQLTVLLVCNYRIPMRVECYIDVRRGTRYRIPDAVE